MKIRVLEVLATLKRAGAERTAVTLAKGLDRSRFECEVVSLYDAFPGGFEPDLDASGVTVRHLDKRPGFDPRMYARLARVMRQFRPDIMHTHSYVMRYAWPVHTGTIVHTVHNLAEREVDRVGVLLHRLALKRGTRFVAIGREVANSFRRVYGAEAHAVIPNGVDLEEPRVARAAWRMREGFRQEDVLIVSVARLAPQKNPLLLMDSLPDDERCHLLLAGEGELAVEVRARAGKRVHLLGMRQDIPDLLHACDIFAMASDYEGLPVAVIEALAAALPVVATNVGGLPELVDDGVNGILVPPRNRVALAEALAKLTHDPDLCRRMASTGVERARTFGAVRMVESYSALFEQMVRTP